MSQWTQRGRSRRSRRRTRGSHAGWWVCLVRLHHWGSCETVQSSPSVPSKNEKEKKNLGWQWLWRVISSRGKPRSQWVWPTAARLEPARPGEDLPGQKEAEGGEKLSQRGRFLIASFISTAGSVAAAGPRVLLSAAAPDLWPPPPPSGPKKIAKTSYTVVPHDSKLAAALHILSKPEGCPAWDPLHNCGYGAPLRLSDGASGERV